MRIKTLLAILVLGSATVGCGTKQDGGQDSATAEMGELRNVRPQDLKNAISLISDDWMLLSAGKEGDFNEMTISWGEMGELWGRPVMTVFVDTTRFTHKYMEREDYFTVCGFAPEYKDDLQYLGRNSGRDGNKLAATKLHAAFTGLGNPYFNEASVVIECRKIYANDFDTSKMTGGMEDFYSKRGSVHTAYIGEITNVWVK